MSTFGAPGTGVKIGRPNPPARGSFPLDHDAECQPIMKQYLRCLKTARGVNSPECRELSKGYLNCRMERGLMAPDEMKNLGYAEGQTVTDDVGKGRKK
jgi:cytochrome c oxidase assembly protein subunit 19